MSTVPHSRRLPANTSAFQARRLRRVRLCVVPLLVGAVLALAFVFAGSALAWTTNLVQLDNGTCGRNLQLGSDTTASASSTPTFWLMGDGGLSSYAAFVDGVSIGTFNSDGSGNVCIVDTTPLATASHVLTANELAPRPSMTVAPFNFSVDTVPPPPPSTPVISSYSDSGVLGDGITMYRAVNLTGSSDPSMTIQLLNNGVTVTGGAKANPVGAWSATTSTLADGTYHFERDRHRRGRQQERALKRDHAHDRRHRAGGRGVEPVVGLDCIRQHDSCGHCLGHRRGLEGRLPSRRSDQSDRHEQSVQLQLGYDHSRKRLAHVDRDRDGRRWQQLHRLGHRHRRQRRGDRARRAHAEQRDRR